MSREISKNLRDYSLSNITYLVFRISKVDTVGRICNFLFLLQEEKFL